MPDEQNVTPAAAPAPASSGKKSNATTIIIIVVVALVVLGVAGYFLSRWIARRAAEKLTSGILSTTTGTNVDISESGVKWPSDMPSDVPKLTTGKITMATSDKTSGIWSVIASDSTQSDYDVYKAKVVAAGWTLTLSTSVGAILDQYEKGSYILNLVFDSSSSGISIGVSSKVE